VAAPTSSPIAPGKRTLVDQLPLIPPAQNAGVAGGVPRVRTAHRCSARRAPTERPFAHPPPECACVVAVLHLGRWRPPSWQACGSRRDAGSYSRVEQWRGAEPRPCVRASLHCIALHRDARELGPAHTRLAIAFCHLLPLLQSPRLGGVLCSGHSRLECPLQRTPCTGSADLTYEVGSDDNPRCMSSRVPDRRA
jgi:hypothetical protein